MLGQRAMTGFAVDLRVHAALFHLVNVGVAGLTGLMTGEVDGAGGDLGDGVPAVVAVLPKTFGNEKAAYE